MTDPDVGLLKAIQDQEAEKNLKDHRGWLDEHRSEYEAAIAQTTSGKYQTEYREAVVDALDRLRGFTPGKDDANKAVYVVGQAVLILGRAEQPLHTIKTYERNEERYQKLVRAREAAK